MNKYLKFLTVPFMVMSFLSGCSSTSEKDIEKKENMEVLFSYDGLQKKESSEHKMVYVHPNLDLSEYNSILLMPAQVAFRKDWQKNFNRDNTNKSSGQRVSDNDALKIKQGAEKLFDEVFTEEFVNNGYPVVKTAQPGTLIIKPSILNLELSAPHTSSPGRTNVYTRDTGTVTLFLEFFDGASGQIIARYGEGKIIGERELFHWANKARNTADGRRLLRTWATQLRTVLDEAHQNEQIKPKK